MQIYNEFFWGYKKSIQGFWLDFVRELDKDMERALKSAVKNSLLDLQKHVKGDHQEIVPIFRVFTVISTTPSKDQDSEWTVVNEPSHAQLKTALVDFIRRISEATSVVPRLERVFRDNYDVLVTEAWKRQIEQERTTGGMGRNQDPNY